MNLVFFFRLIEISNAYKCQLFVKSIFEEMWVSGSSPDEIIESQGLKQISDDGAIEEIIMTVITDNPAQVEAYLGGKDKLLWKGSLSNEWEKLADGNKFGARGIQTIQFIPKKCDVDYLDYNGEKKTLRAEGLLATCIQHEMDHLDGILFIDYLSKLKKSMIIKKLSKNKSTRIVV